MKLVLCSLFFAFSMHAQPFDLALKNSKLTQKHYPNFMFSWTAIHGNNRQQFFAVDVIHAPGKMKLSLYLIAKDQKKLLSTTYIINTFWDTFWYVEEEGAVRKYRPFEAHYAMPNTCLYLMKSNIQFLSSKNASYIGQYASLTNGKYQFYRKMNNEQKEAIQKKVDLLKNKLIPQSSTRAEEKYYLNEAKKLLDYVRSGKLSEVDEKSGVITKMDMTDGKVEIVNFQWVTIPDSELLEPKGHVIDMTKPVDLSKAYLFAYNQQWKPSMYSIQTDGRIYQPEDNSLRRLPFNGTVSTPYDIDLKKELIYITGIPVNSNHVKPYVINNKTGKCAPLGHSYLGRGRSTSLSLSPNRKKLALLHSLHPKKNDKKDLILIELSTGKIQKMTLSQSPQKVIWHPDGKSLFVTQFNESKKKSIISLIAPGKLTSDIIEGASPIILPKAQKILFLDLNDQKWKTSDLEGRDVKLFHDGLSRLQFPVSSISETKLLMILRNKDNYSIPVIYDIKTKQHSPITTRPGLWLNPVWSQ